MDGGSGARNSGYTSPSPPLPPATADLAHLERLPPHHHHPLPHCRPARPACQPHTHPRSHRPHCSPPALSRVADLLGTRFHQRTGLQEAEKGLIRRGGKRKAVIGQRWRGGRKGNRIIHAQRGSRGKKIERSRVDKEQQMFNR